MCVLSCTLGCTSGSGCTVSEIAVNQPLRFQFSRPIDPTSVNSESFRIRTAAGAQPSGTYVVQGNEVAFIPSVRSEGNRTLFGFAENVSYTLEIPGTGSGYRDLVRSTDGGTLKTSFSCKIVANRGVIDLDGKKPRAKLLVPTSLSNVARNTLIVLEFSEVLNTQIFQGGGAGAGILFTVSLVNEAFECERRVKNLPGTVSVNLDERSNKTTVVFRPSILLPQNSCVQVQVTSQIRDLAGKGAVPIAWEFQTKKEQIQNQFVEEVFSDTSHFESDLSGAKWGAGKLVPGKLGGSGILGDFKAPDGVDLKIQDAQKRNIYQWNSDGQMIPGLRTLTGEDITVTNGIFEFQTFTLKSNERVRWIGSKKPILRVSGKVQIDGVMEIVPPPAPSTNPTGQTGFLGGKGICGGGNGGQGGDIPTLSTGNRHGRPGQNVVLPAGHPRAALAAGTGGGGSLGNPQTGLVGIWITQGSSKIFTRQTAAGGAGGSFYSPGAGAFLGTKGFSRKEGNSALYPNYQQGVFGKESVPGKAFQVTPEITGRSSLETFAIGGSGGGGGGSDPFQSYTGTYTWNPGGGGGAGGGVMVLQCGGDLVLGKDAELITNGGNAHSFGAPSAAPFPAPGGGGSGGSVLLQVAGIPTLLGKITSLGGKGGVVKETSYLGMAAVGGDGGAGYIRVESDPKPSHVSFKGFTPASTANNVGLLRAVDYNDVTIAASKWYQTQTLFSPSFRYYVVEAKIDGKLVTYSDNSLVSKVRAIAGEPVVFMIQSAPVNTAGQPIDDPTPWVEDDLVKGGISRLNDYDTLVGNGFRWILRFDTKGGTKKIEILKVKVFYRG